MDLSVDLSISVLVYAASQNVTFTLAGNIGYATLRKLWLDTDAKIWLGLLPLSYWNGEDELFTLVNTLVPVSFLSVCFFNITQYFNFFSAWNPVGESSWFSFLVYSIYVYRVWPVKLMFKMAMFALEHNQASKIMTTIGILWEAFF